MDSSGFGLGESGRQTIFQNPSGEDERQRQQERLNREEAYYQFINELSDEDYRLMRDCNLLGTPGEITADELQQRLQGEKEHLVSQSNTENREGDTVRYFETLELNSTSDSLPEWLNMLRRTGNSSRSEQRRNQTWRAVSQVNPTSGGFRFSLEININHDYNGGDGPNEEFEGVSHGHAIRNHAENTPLIADSPIASRTRSRVLRETFGQATASSRSSSGSGSVAQNDEETPRLFSGRHSTRNSSSATHTFLDDNEHNIIRQRRVQRVASMRLHGGRAGARTWRRTRQRPEALSSQSQTLLEGWQQRDTQQIRRRSRRTHTVHSPSQQGETQVPSLDIIVEEEASGTSSAILGRHPAITVDLEVRRIHPEAYRDLQRIGIRTRSRAGMAENLVASESNSEGFRRTISQPEHTGMQTYDGTAGMPPRRISEIGLGESSSVGLRSIIRQVITELGDLRSLVDVESYHTIQRGVQHLSEMQSGLPNLQSLSSIGEFRETSLGSSPAEQGGREWDGEARAAQHGSHDETQDHSQAQDANSLIGNGTLPILRLVPYLLLDDYTSDRLRGLTKDQMDSLSTRSYGTTTAEGGEISKTCSVCMNEYVVGNKLRQLPCMHEFHFHCIDRWLSENSTCPICRQSVVT
uniref:E3 ubiquitin-protein ligase RNF6 n=1 Tax=Euleptes europaea TaxID=460621 RepID=UPI002540CA87|nr:E3 ubiquitin-protein ligase RNF6 [Euleptes europaea]